MSSVQSRVAKTKSEGGGKEGGGEEVLCGSIAQDL